MRNRDKIKKVRTSNRPGQYGYGLRGKVEAQWVSRWHLRAV